MSELVTLCAFLANMTTCIPEPPSLADMQVVMSHYWPPNGGINCDVDCSTLADGLPWYESEAGQIAACIPQWLGSTVVTPFGSFKCRDTGGMIRPYYSWYHGQWVIPVDVMAESIGYNQCVGEWEVIW